MSKYQKVIAYLENARNGLIAFKDNINNKDIMDLGPGNEEIMKNKIDKAIREVEAIIKELRK